MPEKYSEADSKLLRHVGEILRQHRRKCGLTQEQVAELAEINVTYRSDVERGKRNVSLINLARLAKAFGIPLEDVLKGDGEAKNNYSCKVG